MADRVRELFIELGFEAKRVDEGLQRVDANLKKTTKGAGGLGAALSALGGLAIIGKIKEFGGASIEAARALETQTIKLQGLSREAFPELSSAMTETIKASRGLSSVGELAEASNAFLDAGGNVAFLTQNLGQMQKLAVASGKGVTQTFEGIQKAVLKGEVGFFEQNATLAKYIDKFQAIGAGSGPVAQAARQQLLMNALAEEGGDIQAKYNEYLESSEALAKINATAWGDLQENVGALLLKGLNPLLKVVNPVLQFFTDAEHGMARTTTALLVLTPIVGSVLVAALYSAAIAGWAAIAPWLPFIGIAALVGAGLAGLVLIIDDLYTWLMGGESVIGEFLGPFVDASEFFDGFWGGIQDRGQAVWDGIKKGGANAWAFVQKGFWKLINFAKFAGKILIMALFPVSVLYFYWDEISAFFTNAVDYVMELVKPLQDAFGAIGSFFTGDAQTSNIEARASGGPVKAGKMYIVGEEGPEPFIPAQDGMILPNSSLSAAPAGGGGGGIKFAPKITIIVQSGREAASELKSMLRTMLDELALEYRAQLGLT